MIKLPLRAGALALVLLLPGCLPLTDAQPEDGILEVALDVEPLDVAQRDTFTVRLIVRNPTRDTVRVQTPSSCLALPYVERGGETVPFAGEEGGCAAVQTTHTFIPGETRTIAWELQAELADGRPVPTGMYVARARFETSSVTPFDPGRSFRVRLAPADAALQQRTAASGGSSAWRSRRRAHVS